MKIAHSNHNKDNPQKKSHSQVALFGPVRATERIGSVDVLRGLAVLGILVINIEFFALPNAIYFNPKIAGGFSGLNFLSWKFGYLFFLQKMMAIFSMLFGAGLILLGKRAESSGKKFKGIYYQRIFWLLVIGAVHAYFFWYGDILFTYAICGLILYPFRRRSARLLIILGFVFLIFGVFIQMGSGYYFSGIKKEAKTAQTALDSGEDLTPYQEQIIKVWGKISGGFNPTPEKIEEEVKAYRGNFFEILRYRAPHSFMMQTQVMIFMMFWRVAGLMLLGMGLMKLGVFSADRTKKFYITCVIVGYGVGLPICVYGADSLVNHNFDFVYFFQMGAHFNYLGSVLVALAHTSVVMLICKSGYLGWLTQRLSAVGRIALSNYLLHTIICTTIFYGYGLGLFNKVERFGLWGFVLGIWILQLMVSPIWLKQFRFGPAEWLWRSLTYWRRQPMRT